MPVSRGTPQSTRLQVVISETIGVSDSVSVVAIFKRTITEAVNVAEDIVRISSFFRAISESVSISESLNIIKSTPIQGVARILSGPGMTAYAKGPFSLQTRVDNNTPRANIRES